MAVLGTAVTLRESVLPRAVLSRHDHSAPRSSRALSRLRLDPRDQGRAGVADRDDGGYGAERTRGGHRVPAGGRSLTSGADLARLEEELLHVAEQEFLRFGIPKVQCVVIDELLLHLGPLTPADRTDLLVGSLAYIVLKRLKRHSLALVAAAHAVHVAHARKIDVTRSVIQCTGATRAQHYVAVTVQAGGALHHHAERSGRLRQCPARCRCRT